MGTYRVENPITLITRDTRRIAVATEGYKKLVHLINSAEAIKPIGRHANHLLDSQ